MLGYFSRVNDTFYSTQAHVKIGSLGTFTEESIYLKGRWIF